MSRTPEAKWHALSRDEWVSRLEHARTVILERIASRGVSLDGEPQPAAIILDLGVGSALRPRLEDAKRNVNAAVATIGDPMLPNGCCDEREFLSDLIGSYAIGAAEAGFILGCIAGTAVSWPVVCAMEPPHVPPQAGGAR